MATLEPDLYEILAQLDFLLQNSARMSLQDKGYKNHKKSVLARIAKRMGCSYTAERVRIKLWQAFRYMEKFPKHSFDLIFSHGSSAFNLSGEQREGVETHLEVVRLQNDTPGRTLRSRSLRSESIVTMQSKNRRQRSNTMGLDLTTKSRRSCTRSNGNVAGSRLDAPKHQARKCRAERPVEIVSSSIEIQETPCQSPGSALMAADMSSPVISPVISARKLDPELDDTMSALCFNRMDEGPDSEQEAIRAPPFLSDADLTIMAAELAHYKTRCEEAEEKAKRESDLRQQIQSLSEVPEAGTDLISQLRGRINKLQKRQEDRKNLERYLPIGDTLNGVIGSHEVLTQFEVLKGQIPSLLVLDGTDEPHVWSLRGCTSDLDDLLIDVFGKDFLCGHQKPPDTFPSVTAFELIQSLVGAALKLWVFDSDTHIYAFAMTQLLQGYRKFIDTVCGHDSLCNIDHAVHGSIIRSQPFEKVIVPGISDILVTRLIDALAPVFRTESRSDGVKKLKPSLYEIVQMAVQLRSDMLITGDGYEMIWPSVGCSFDRKEMQPKGTKSIRVTSAVRLPLCPGLRVYVKEKAMVDYRGFKSIPKSTVDLKHVVKALVLR